MRDVMEQLKIPHLPGKISQHTSCERQQYDYNSEDFAGTGDFAVFLIEC